MCGLAAVFEPGRLVDEGLLHSMARDLLHRGPDGGDVMAETGLGLAFRRLAIIDPTAASDQPMSDPTGRFSLIFNGEIYNFRDLRRQLRMAGVQFQTEGDAEVILQGYMHWGEAIFSRLEGMFALVIVDRQRQHAIAARDPFGIKPLYRCSNGSRTILASEVRPILRLMPARPDPGALAELLVFRFAAGRKSNLTGIELVPGGCLLEISLTTGHVRERRYCDTLESLAPDETITETEALEMAEEAITRSLQQHLESDVGYSLQLSGGIDSGLVSALAARASGQKLMSFGVQLEDARHDESRWREPIVERYGLDHHEILITGKDFANALPRAVASMEGPVPHYGCVMLMLLCETIRKHSKVVLTGEGADELFGGYSRYGDWRDLRRAGRLARFVPEIAAPLLRRYDGIMRYRNRDAAIYGSVYHDVRQMVRLFPDLAFARSAREDAAARFQDFRSRMLASDQTAYLSSLLMRQDKMAMAASVEARVPFTHWPLFKVINRIPHRLRIPGGETKPLLKRIAEKYLPVDLVRRRKVGLTLPLEEWLADPSGLGGYLDLLTDGNCRLAAYGERRLLREAVSAFRAGRRHGLPPLPLLVNVELWLRSLQETPTPCPA